MQQHGPSSSGYDQSRSVVLDGQLRLSIGLLLRTSSGGCRGPCGCGCGACRDLASRVLGLPRRHRHRGATAAVAPTVAATWPPVRTRGGSSRRKATNSARASSANRGSRIRAVSCRIWPFTAPTARGVITGGVGLGGGGSGLIAAPHLCTCVPGGNPAGCL
jgi:hypothetical protein